MEKSYDNITKKIKFQNFKGEYLKYSTNYREYQIYMRLYRCYRDVTNNTSFICSCDYYIFAENYSNFEFKKCSYLFVNEKMLVEHMEKEDFYKEIKEKIDKIISEREKS